MRQKPLHKTNPRDIGQRRKQSILAHFGGDFTSFYTRYLPDLKGHKANCPFHDCDSKSLSVDTKTGLFNCHFPGCRASGDVFKFYALKHSLDGDFPAVLHGIAADFDISDNDARLQQSTPKKFVKHYAYYDSDGKVLFYKNRYEPKGFSISRPNGEGGYISGLGAVEPVLYNMPEIIDADEVFVVEGEKDADNLNALGFTATTNFDGAGKWKDGYTDTLHGKKVFIIPDNDDEGRKHAQKVARELQGRAKSIRLIELPGLPPKGDVSDFIAGIGDTDTAAERLSIMAEGAAEWTPPAESEPETEAPSSFQFVHNAIIMATLRPIEWLIRDILTDYSFYYNFGDPGHFKTFIELDRLLCIAGGKDYHGHKVKQGAVFYICGEGYQGIGRRIAAWHIANGTKTEEVPFFVSKTPTQLVDLKAVEDVRRAVDDMAKRYGPPAVVHIDTLARNFGEGDENATRDMNTVIANLDKAFGADFCRGLNHTGHGNKDRARGPIALHGAADAAFRVSQTDSGLIVVECKKLKDAPTPPLMVFDRREVLLQIGDTEDRSYVLELAAEGEEALHLVKAKKAIELKGCLQKALDILRRLYVRYEDNLRKSDRSAAAPSVSYADWRTACMDAGLYKRTDNFRNAAEKLLLHGLIRFDESKKFVYLFEITSEDEI
jgi:5S rRNA maturation endonuclease (ribonuclease M5)